MAYWCEEDASAAHKPPALASASAGSREPVASLGNTHGIAVPLGDVLRVTTRLWRYRMQSYVREILRVHIRPNGYAERVSYCLRKMSRLLKDWQGVTYGPEIWAKSGKAQYVGLMICGSVWLCPVCAAKISEFKRKELVAGVDKWVNRGGMVVLLSQTAPHKREDGLQSLLDRFTRARFLMHNRKAWRTWKDRSGLAGSVRALEVTFGFQSGWHVHVHEILFFEDEYQRGETGELEEKYLPQMKADLYNMWKAACTSAGLGEPTFRRGIDVQNGRFAAGYAAKWGIESELTKGHLKRSKGGNLGPFGMVEEYSKGRLIYRDLFCEYGEAFKARKQLRWSDGMRGLVDLGEEVPDGDLVGQIDEDEVRLGQLTFDQWNLVVAAEKRGELLEVACSGGWSGVLAFIEELV